MEIVANAIQTVAVNQNILFTDTIVKCNKWISHREGSGLITLKGLRGCDCECQPRARYLATFSGNIALPDGGTAGPISVALSIDGEPAQSTNMIVTPADAGDYFNVSSSTYIEPPNGCCVRIAVENTSGVPINVQNANLIAVRVS